MLGAGKRIIAAEEKRKRDLYGLFDIADSVQGCVKYHPLASDCV